MNVQITDTIVCDTNKLEAFIRSGNYDYSSEIAETEKSIFEKIMSDIKQWIKDLFDGVFNAADSIFTTNEKMQYVWLGLGIIAILVLLYVMYRKKMLFFAKKEKKEDDYEVVEDTIYGIDFEKDISRALGSGNYREAIRLRYLQCLKLLSDSDKIEWRIYKTPAQYTREYKNDDFSNLTRRYVLVRYGDYEATQAIFDDISDKYKSIENQLSLAMPSNTVEEGGGDET